MGLPVRRRPPPIGEGFALARPEVSTLAMQLGRRPAGAPRLVVTDRLASYRTALGELKRDGRLPARTRHRRGLWLNNRVEQDHQRIKRRTRPMLDFKRFATARRVLAGIEVMAMLAKGQVRGMRAGDASAQRDLVLRIFGLAA